MNNNALLKTIYYCWFGRTQIPDKFVAYLDTWSKFFPEYTIVEINEETFDISAYAYAKTAYAAGKYAFVSDVARIHFLQKNGGIYLDTDVEIRSSFDNFFQKNEYSIFGVILSMEYFMYEITGVNTATIISKPDQKIWGDLLDIYKTTNFLVEAPKITINQYLNTLLQAATSFKYKDVRMELSYHSDSILILPSNIWARKTKNSLAYHHLQGSWSEITTPGQKLRRLLGITIKKIIGRRLFEKLWKK
ncbi:glycosyl transferase [Erysipelotrichaceae bacterium]|nr:glycosyl transferase [Erysipelotrichaceae bacterium]